MSQQSHPLLQPFKAPIDKVLAELQVALEKDSELQFTSKVLKLSMNPEAIHNSSNNPEYYEALLESLLESIQHPTEKNVIFACMMRYMERVEWAGLGPVFRFNSSLPSSELIEIEPVFNLYCQDDEELPHSRLVGRFSLNSKGEFTIIVLDSEWLTGGPVDLELPKETPAIIKAEKQPLPQPSTSKKQHHKRVTA